VRDGVVEVVVVGLGAAAGGRAGAGAGADQVLEFAAGDVAVFGVAVLAGLLGDRGEREVQAAQEPGERGGTVWGAAGGRRRDPLGVGAAGAGVRGGGAAGGQEGCAQACAGMGGGGVQEAAGVAGVGQSPAADLAGRG